MTEQDVINYIDSANALAVSLEKDLKKGSKISSKTVLALNEFVKMSEICANLVESVLDQKSKIN